MAWWQFWKPKAVPKSVPKALELSPDFQRTITLSEFEHATIEGSWNHHRTPEVVWIINGAPQTFTIYPQFPGHQANIYRCDTSPRPRC